jgi:hypothetical protein
MARQFVNNKIESLEALFDESRHSETILNVLAQELAVRSSKRAKNLHERVVQALAVLDKKPMPEDEEPWSGFERSLSDAERAYILRSPANRLPSAYSGMSLWEQGIEQARVSEHMLVPGIVKSLDEKGRELKVNSDGYGLAMRLAQFEIRNSFVTSWPAFALLFRKMLGPEIVPWLPSLYLGAIMALHGNSAVIDLIDIVSFRDEFAVG